MVDWGLDKGWLIEQYEMIKAEFLTRNYGKLTAVNEVSFQIEPQEIVGLLGHNGAGKTTVMKMITGCLEPTSGTISINGLDAYSQRLEIQKEIGYLPENCPLYLDMTVLDYLDYIATLRGVPDNKKIERISHVIEKTKIESVAENLVNTLSRGYRQRLGVAQAIINSPRILILDEPTNGLDPLQIHEMRSLIKEVSSSATILISTHILQEVQAVCGRVIIINRGKKALDANISDLQAAGQLYVATNMEPRACTAVMEDAGKLKMIGYKVNDSQHCYTLETQRELIADASASLAQRLVEHGCKIYALKPVVRDLETIFQEITGGRDD